MTRISPFLVVLLSVLRVAPAAPQAAESAPSFEAYVESIPGTTVRFDMMPVKGGVLAPDAPKAESGKDVPVVPVAPFFMGKHEVTWDEFEAFYLTKETADGPDAITRPTPFYLPHDRGFGRGRRPAVGISWHAATTYCAWLSRRTGRTYRLPTEIEWEYACRAGAPPIPPEEIPEHAWFAGNSGGKTEDVGRKRPNAFGLCDMLGNALEYCRDLEGGRKKRAVLRGGSFASEAAEVHPARRQIALDAWNERDPQRPRSPWWLVDAPFAGFRVVRPIIPEPGPK